jgi:hypothetical protein
MFAQVLCLCTAVVGVNVGWQPLPEGGTEYIIQLDPQTLEALKAGQPIQSDIHPGAGDVRSYRIIMGTKQPQRINPAPSGELSEKAAAQARAFPRKLIPDPDVKPLAAAPAAFEEPAGASRSGAARTGPTDVNSDQPARPWMPLIVVSLALFASLGGNVFLTWIFADLRRRYRMLLSQ